MTGESHQESAQSDPAMTIGVFSRRTRLSPKALRLYDRIGLLTPAEVDRENGYRHYRESQLERARMIGLLRRIDMPLAKVAEILAVSPEAGADILADYWNGAQATMMARYDLAFHLHNRMLGKEGPYEMFEVKERDVPEQFLLTEQRHITAPELPNWIPESFTRLMASAAAHGGVRAAPIVVYHGEINEDSDGPAEAGVPIDPAQASSVSVPGRIEPAHREAYVTLRKAQVVFPQILSAYDAVEKWIRDNGKTVAGSPREVNFGDWMTSGPDDEVIDVAFPIASE